MLDYIYHKDYGESLCQPDDHVVSKGDDIFLSPCFLKFLLAGPGPGHHLVLPRIDRVVHSHWSDPSRYCPLIGWIMRLLMP